MKCWLFVYFVLRGFHVRIRSISIVAISRRLVTVHNAIYLLTECTSPRTQRKNVIDRQTCRFGFSNRRCHHYFRIWNRFQATNRLCLYTSLSMSRCNWTEWIPTEYTAVLWYPMHTHISYCFQLYNRVFVVTSFTVQNTTFDLPGERVSNFLNSRYNRM